MRPFVATLLAILVLAGLAAGGWYVNRTWFSSIPSAAPIPAPTPPPPQPAPTPKPAPAPKPAPTPKPVPTPPAPYQTTGVVLGYVPNKNVIMGGTSGTYAVRYDDAAGRVRTVTVADRPSLGPYNQQASMLRQAGVGGTVRMTMNPDGTVKSVDSVSSPAPRPRPPPPPSPPPPATPPQKWIGTVIGYDKRPPSPPGSRPALGAPAGTYTVRYEGGTATVTNNPSTGPNNKGLVLERAGIGGKVYMTLRPDGTVESVEPFGVVVDRLPAPSPKPAPISPATSTLQPAPIPPVPISPVPISPSNPTQPPKNSNNGKVQTVRVNSADSKTFAAPQVPSWVKGDPQKHSKESVRKAGKRNADIVQKANKSRTKYDFVLYGDSITQFVGDKYMDIWNKYFGGMKSAPLGIGGDTVEELSWRLVYGKEKFTVDPKTVAILIGINNIKSAKNDPAEKMEFLMPWLRATWPTTRFILLNILPNDFVSVKDANKKYEKLSEKYGFEYATCGSTLNPKDKKLFKDGTHPAPDGYHAIYSCLRDRVRKHS